MKRPIARYRPLPRAALPWLIAAAAVAPSVEAQDPLRISRITPAGADVDEGRQIVFQFDRPVVPLGRMDRDASEVPIAIEPPLACRWRWIDTSALACQLGEEEALQPATRYSIVVEPGIVAVDGAALAAPVRHEFVTQRPSVVYAGFATWRGPGTPVMRVLLTQPVTAASVRDHLFITLAGDARRRAVLVEADPDDPNSQAGAAAEGTPLAPDEARRVFLISPSEPLPLDAHARLHIEPGLQPVEGRQPGQEDRVVVEFDTFPELRFAGVTCSTNDGEQVTIAANRGVTTDGGAALDEGVTGAGSDTTEGRACNPLGGVGLSYSAPVVTSEVRDHVRFTPDLAGGREDFDPWANSPDYSQLYQPHRSGQHYTVWLPGRLAAAVTYRIVADALLNDEFGRGLGTPIDLTFRTDHRPPDYTLTHSTAVLETGIDSDVPLYVTNLTDVVLDYRVLTPSGRRAGLTRSTALPDVADVSFAVPLGVRDLLDGESGAVYGELSTKPALERPAWDRRLFAQVTPYQLHVKLGHFNTLVWVTDLTTGAPVRDADVSLYTDRIADLSPDAAPMATSTTDRDGVALLAGSALLDPALDLLGYGCRAAHPDECPKLFVRVDGPKGLALLPLDDRFEANVFRASSFSFWSQPAPVFGHLHAWGTTAQGVYRAGDTMQFKLYVRDQDNETYVAAPPGPYRLDIVDPAGRKVHTVDALTLSELGSWSGSFRIPDNAGVGWYQFELTAGFDARSPPGTATEASAASSTSADAGAAAEDGWNPTRIVRFPMRVLVSDFTPASFGVTTQLNGDYFEAGDEVVAETRAALHSGGPYSQAEARITARIDARPFVSRHPVAALFTFSTLDEQRNLPPSMTVAQRVGNVGAQGELRDTFTIPADAGSRIVFGTLSVEGAVRDDRGRYVASSASADYVAVDRLVGLRSTRWVYEQGSDADVEYVVVDARGTPVAGTDVQVSVERLETKASRVKGAGDAYLTRYVDEWAPTSECEGVSQESPATCRFTPEAPGSYRLTARIADTQGRAHRTVLHTWVTGARTLVWSSGNEDVLEIVPEQAKYAVGDTARYLLKNPYPGARALVTVERYGTLKQWVQTLEGNTPIVEFEVEKDFLPGFYLSVVVMSPRVAAPPPEVGELDLGKPAFRLGYVAVPVEDPYKQIDVRVTTDAESYRPGDTVRAEISAAPRERERREPIEAAVVVLDEAVLDLIQGGSGYFDPYEGFYSLDPLDVRNFGLLTRLVGRQKIELKGANPGGDGGATLAMRSLFEYVSYWNPSIRLDGRGRGEFEFQVPDNLTGWRVLVIATTPTDRFGLGMQRFTVNLPTEIRPVMPNQVAEGDRFTAAFSIMNRTDEARDIRVTVTAEGDVAAPVAHETTVSLAPYQRTTVAAPVEAGRIALDAGVAVGNIRFAATAEDETDGDSLAHSVPVRSRRVLETVAQHGSLEGEFVSEPLRVPSDIAPGVGSVGAVLAPSAIGGVEGAFRYVRDLPYSSWEQRLTRAVMASRYGELAAYLPDDFEWPDAAAVPAQVLAQAASHQAPSGGMTFFRAEDAYASPYLSAYTALAFGWLRDGGHTIPAAVETKLHEYLATLLRREVAPDFYSRGMVATTRAVALAALAKAGRLGADDLSRYRDHVAAMSLFGKAHYLIAASSAEGGDQIAREVVDLLLDSANRAAGTLSFNEVLDGAYSRILATPLRANCAILSALVESGVVGGVEADIDSGIDAGNGTGIDSADLVASITRAREGRDYWRNTQENVFCVNALADYARRYESETPNLQVSVALGAETIGTASFTSPRDGAVAMTRPLRADDAGRADAVQLRRSGSGRLFYTARIDYAPTTPAPGGIDAGVDIQREYSVQRDGAWVVLDDPARVARGELVRVDLFVSLPTARNFLVVDDAVPGGLEPVSRDLATASAVDADAGAGADAVEGAAGSADAGAEGSAGAQPAPAGSRRRERSDWRAFGSSGFQREELAHDSVRFYAEYLPPGHYHLSYAAQAIATGDFDSPPARAAEMYDPEVFGSSAPGRLVVEEP